MQDAITNVINKSDVQGLYLDMASMTNLESYFASGELRVRAAATISANASAIIRDAVAKALLYSDITRPGGNMYTTRRYAACIRDLDYYLRLVTYGIVAGDVTPIEEIGVIGAKEL
jgi:allophycocyanin beta subunit